MKISKRHKIIIISSIVILVLLTVVSYCWSRKSVSVLEKRQQSQMSPVIMIPGSSATVNRFDTLVAKINQRDRQNHSLLKVKVYNNGKITYTGQIRQGDNEPFIVVGFENNHDGYSNIKKQARMFNTAFNQLKAQYNFNNFKGIGHSNGGLIYTYFLEHYFNERQIRIKRLMTIGTPYNFAEPSNRRTQMLTDFIKNRKKLPNNLTMYSIAGSENYVEDGLVPLSSVLAGKYIYQGEVRHYTQITVTGKLAQHSALPQNQEVLSLIRRYILNPHPERARPNN
ncbi:alpha/beta hydrolase [Limosilactobacillus balticus]|uniref:Alpha/beta hydrolase n=1 Tax=Limosilactobacillus balticus TaxID=2759747 RepID=A0ABS8RCF5_9LACO|nr:alpha/beta hydrolase [Limosilactobacillus balticus]MBB1127779.1 alpha/beta hydrolase [Limosilactobacillus balticus]MCD7136718.1 alpha/beta hydrolase [Limosilactobacillus balticus]MCD7138630.1 alpha/beta hydrolase [Limosilactobacillus balticus]